MKINILDNIREGHIIIPNKIDSDERLLPNEKLTFGYLAKNMNENYQVDISNGYISKFLGVDNRTARGYVERLDNFGYIERILHTDRTRSIIINPDIFRLL